MSKIAGIENAQYEIEFFDSNLSETDEKVGDRDTQILVPVDESDLETVMKNHVEEGDLPYARMKVAGTNTWFVWFLRGQ